MAEAHGVGNRKSMSADEIIESEQKTTFKNRALDFLIDRLTDEEGEVKNADETLSEGEWFLAQWVLST